jgi:hypothetical protein
MREEEINAEIEDFLEGPPTAACGSTAIPRWVVW